MLMSTRVQHMRRSENVKKKSSFQDSRNALASHDTWIFASALLRPIIGRQHASPLKQVASCEVQWEGGRRGRRPRVTRERSYGMINNEATQIWARRDIPRRWPWWRGCVVPLATTAVVPVCHYQQEGGSWGAQISGQETLYDQNMETGGKEKSGWERQRSTEGQKEKRVHTLSVYFHLNVNILWSFANH